MNVWNFTGHLGHDCAVKSTQSGKSVCEFSVAVTSGYGDNQKTTWANCVLFGKRAEGKLPEHLVTGQKVAISGEVTLEQWEAKDGSKGKTLKVYVNSLDLIGAKSEPKQQPAQQAPPPQQAEPGKYDDFDDNIPFR